MTGFNESNGAVISEDNAVMATIPQQIFENPVGNPTVTLLHFCKLIWQRC